MSIFGQDTRRRRNGTLFLAGREVFRDGSADSLHILQCFALEVGGHDGVCTPDVEDCSYARGFSLDKTVGRNSATVGWICIARCMTVYGAFAYMASSRT